MLLALLRTGAAEVAAMFAAARLFEPVLELCFRLKFNNVLHNLALQVCEWLSPQQRRSCRPSHRRPNMCARVNNKARF